MIRGSPVGEVIWPKFPDLARPPAGPSLIMEAPDGLTRTTLR
jgi:hypothetical protein